MVMRWMIGVLLVSCAFAADLPANLRKDVDAGNQAWVDGLKAGDPDHVVLGFAEDSVDCNPAGDCLKGPIAETTKYKALLARLGRATRAFVRSEALRVDHDLAYESGYAEAHFADGTVLKGRFCTVWKLQSDGHWKIFRNLPLPPAP